MNYWIIDILIFLFGCGASFCFMKFSKSKTREWLLAALGLKLLEGEAARARARQESKE